jgi:hypothetical protein
MWNRPVKLSPNSFYHREREIVTLPQIMIKTNILQDCDKEKKQEKQ